MVIPPGEVGKEAVAHPNLPVRWTIRILPGAEAQKGGAGDHRCMPPPPL